MGESEAEGPILDKDAIQGVLNSIDTKLKTLKDIDDQLFDVTPVEDLEMAIIEADDYIESIQTKVRKLRISAITVDPPINAHVVGRDGSTMNNSPMALSNRRVNLPKLQLPTFDGNILKWTPFYDGFCAAVHNDDNLDNTQKFQYLASTLTGEASRAIDGLPLTNANYDEALSVLKQRYGQPHKIIAGYVKALWELPKPTDSIASVKDFYDSLETYIRGLKSLGKMEESYGDLLIPIILEKLPGSLKTHISRTHGDKAWTLPELKEAVYKEIQASEAGNVDILGHEIFRGMSSAAALHVGARSRQRNSYMPNIHICAFCKGKHFPNECLKVTNKSKRYDIVRHDKLCFNCLRSNHMIHDCTAKGRCKTCQGKHHTSLCTTQDDQMATPYQRPLDKPTEDTHV